MNEHFVNIKVDREERPDLDSIYMTAVQAMTGHGGWPLNVFLTPDGTPFYGGTYFPPEDRPGLPGFRQGAGRRRRRLSGAARRSRRECRANPGSCLRRSSRELPAAGRVERRQSSSEAVEQLARSFDARNGGFGGAPKFPQPAIVEFLLRQS